MSRLMLERAVFGLAPTLPEVVPDAVESARKIDEALGPGQVAMITGPSGAGKSTILRHLRRELGARGNRPVLVDPSGLDERARVIEAIPGKFDSALSLLASCGLADALILERRIRELSAGQRWRLGLARALRRAQRCGPHATLLIDEFCATLDADSAACLCRTLRRWVSVRPIRAVCATSNDSLLEFLAPSVLAIQPLSGAASIHLRRDDES